MASCVLESSSKGASSSAGSGGAKAAAGPSAGVEEVDVKGHALVLLGVLKTLGAGGKKATLLQVGNKNAYVPCAQHTHVLGMHGTCICTPWTCGLELMGEMIVWGHRPV